MGKQNKFGSKKRINAVRKTPCVVCGTTPSENHHATSRGAGGGVEDIVPLCKEHHDDLHTMGRSMFQRKYDVDLYAEARRIAEHLKGIDA